MRKSLLVTLLTLSVFVVSAQQSPGSLANNFKEQEIQFDLVKPPKEESWNTRIMAIAQDRLGFLWFGTLNGLYRYDGSKCVAFHHEPNNSNSLGNNWLHSVYADKGDYLLLGTFGGGVDRYDLSTGKFTHYRYSATDPASLSNDTVITIVKEKDDQFWVGTHNGLNLFNAKTGKFIRYKNDPNDPASLSDNQVRALLKDRAGTLWVGTKSPFPHDGGGRVGGLNRYDATQGQFIRYMHNPNDATSLIDNKVSALFEDSRGTFWVGTAGDGLHTMDREKGTFVRHRYSATHPDGLSRPPVGESDTSYFRDYITFITEDSKRNIWIGTIGNGINVYNPVSKKSTHYRSEQSSSDGLKDFRFTTAFPAKEGSLWTASFVNTNLYKIYGGQTALPHYTIGKRVTSFLEDQEEGLWITTSQGLLRKNKDGNTTQFLVDKNPASYKNRMQVVVGDNQKSLWIGTLQGLHHFSPITQTFTTYRHETGNQNSLICDTVFALAKDRDNRLWIGTDKGLDVMDERTGTFKHYLHNPHDSTSLGGMIFRDDGTERVRNILVTSNNTIWVCVGGGINRLNEQKGNFKKYRTGRLTYHLMEDSGGTLWAGTSSGLYRYDKKSDDFELFTDPLKVINRNSMILHITEDHQKALWLKTPKGLIKLNINKGEASAYENNEQSYSSLFLRSYITRSGKIFSGDTTGYFEFHPDELSKATPPNVVVTGFSISDNLVLPGQSSILTQAVYETNDIRLKYNQNSFGFTFSVIDFSGNGEDKHMLYILENYETKWHKGDEGTADYYNILPGSYRFKVKAVGSNGVWVEKTVAFIVAPPWWRTWWAYCIYGLLFIAGVYGVHRFQRQRLISRERERARAKESAQAKEIEKAYRELKATQTQLIQSEKMASLGELTAGIAHEIQNPLNFINNFSDVNAELIAEMKEEIDKRNMEDVKAIANDIEENEEKINHHGKRADAIVKGMLQHSRTSKGEKEPTDINALADEYLRLSYHGLRAKDKDFNASFATNFDKSIGKIEVVPQDIGRVLLNLYNNAFYAVNEKKKQLNGTFEPTVEVSTKRISSPSGAGGLELRVKDNGIGIPQKVLDKIYQPFFTTKPTGLGTGLGLSLSYDIVKAHGGKLEVETKEGEGAEFIIILPELI